VISQAFFSSLSEEHQALVKISMQSATEHQQELVNGEEAGQLAKIKESGVNVVELSPEQRAVFAAKTASVRAGYRDTVGADAFDGWVAAVATVTAQ
jgi:TRAP-type C4-dicarboxylate transport system substrate-binding protein